MTVSFASARQISSERASQIAHRFLASVTPTTARSQERLLASEAPTFYIYNRSTPAGGFVLVNKDDSRGELLGYSTSGSFHLDSLPEGLRRFFLQLPTETRSGQEARALDFPQTARQPIPPLLKSQWGQVGYPYNSFTPLSGTQHTPSGCVAVAMAQIMYHHRWPLQGQGSHTHPNASLGLGTVDFSQHRYAWEEMLPVYGQRQLYDRRGMPYPPEDPRFTSVSRLMVDAGIAVDMRYTGSYSGSFSDLVPRAMREHFGYESTEILTPKALGHEQLERYIESELRAGFPLYISGGNSSGLGHAWVVDGMDSRGLFHMNFGWEGQSDGYYSLRAITPSELGAEFSGRRRPAFTANLQFIALHPKKPDSAPLDTQAEGLQPRLRANLGSYIRLVEASKTSLLVEMSDIINEALPSFAGDYGYGLYDEAGTLLRIYPSKYHPKGGYRALPRGGSINGKEQDRLPLTDLPEGHYELRLLSAERTTPEGAWGPWLQMQESPRLRFVLSGGQATVLEEGGIGRGIQPLTQPLHGELTPGVQAQIGLLLKNLTGVERDLSLSLHLLGAGGERLSSTRIAGTVSLTSQGRRLVYFQLSLPADLTPGKYRVELEASTKTEKIPVQRYELREDLFLQVQAPAAGRLALHHAEVMTSPASPLAGFALLDLGANPELRLRFHLQQAPTAATTSQELRVYLVDTESQERLLCGATSVSELRRSGTPSSFTSQPLGTLLGERLREGRVYRLAIEGQLGGQSYDLWPSVLEQAYLSFRGVSTPATAPTPAIIQALDPSKPEAEETPTTPAITPVDEASSVAPLFRYFPQSASLQLSGEDLRLVEVFSLTGVRLLQQTLGGGTEAELSLQSYPAGIYLVRVLSGQASHTFRLAR